MHNALRLITTGTVLTLSIALAMEPGIAESTPASSTKPASAVNPANSVGVLIEQAEAQLERGETQTAIATLRQAIAADPSSSLAYTRLGGAYLLNQDYSSAIDQFQQAPNSHIWSAPRCKSHLTAWQKEKLRPYIRRRDEVASSPLAP